MAYIRKFGLFIWRKYLGAGVSCRETQQNLCKTIMYILGCRYDDDDDDDDASGVRFTKYSIFGKMAKHEKKKFGQSTRTAS